MLKNIMICIGVAVLLYAISAELSRVTMNANNSKNEAIRESIQVAKNDTKVLYTVTNVIDGDTIDIKYSSDKKRLRLLGINTPESTGSTRGRECFGDDAKKYVREYLLNQKVSIEYDPQKPKVDEYGRHLVYVYKEDGTLVNAHLIKLGFAREYTYKKERYSMQDQFNSLENNARVEKVGLWKVCNQ